MDSRQTQDLIPGILTVTAVGVLRQRNGWGVDIENHHPTVTKQVVHVTIFTEIPTGYSFQKWEGSVVGITGQLHYSGNNEPYSHDLNIDLRDCIVFYIGVAPKDPPEDE